MPKEIPEVRNWTASQKCTVVLKEGFAWVRRNDSSAPDSTLKPTQMVTLKEGDRIVSLEGCKIEVEDAEDG